MKLRCYFNDLIALIWSSFIKSAYSQHQIVRHLTQHASQHEELNLFGRPFIVATADLQVFHHEIIEKTAVSLPYYRTHVCHIEQISALEGDEFFVNQDSAVYLTAYSHAVCDNGIAQFRLSLHNNLVEETWLGHSDVLTAEYCNTLANLSGVVALTPSNEAPFNTMLAKPDLELQVDNFDKFKTCLSELNHVAADMIDYAASEPRHEFQRRTIFFPSNFLEFAGSADIQSIFGMQLTSSNVINHSNTSDIMRSFLRLEA